MSSYPYIVIKLQACAYLRIEIDLVARKNVELPSVPRIKNNRLAIFIPAAVRSQADYESQLKSVLINSALFVSKDIGHSLCVVLSPKESIYVSPKGIEWISEKAPSGGFSYGLNGELKGVIEEDGMSPDTRRHDQEESGESPCTVDSSQIEYVDEDGNPLNLSDIDFESMEFTDEVGRKVDKNGTLIDNAENCCYSRAIEFLRMKKFSELYKIVCVGCEVTNERRLKIEFIKLKAIALGSLGRHKEARIALLEVLEVSPHDGFVLANYITACLASADRESACGAIEFFYRNLDGRSKGAVLTSLVEAIRVGDMALKRLPAVVIPDLSQFIKMART